MEVWYSLCLKIWPLYIPIILGYMGGRLLKVDRQSVASLLFYFIVPAVFFNTGLKAKLEVHFLLLPVLYFGISVCLCYLYLYFAGKIWSDGKANVIAFAAGSANSGYFGFPLASLLFDGAEVGIYMLTNIGISIYDYTVGAYTMSRSMFAKSEAIKKVVKLPMIYAFLLGVICNYFDLKLPQEIVPFMQHFSGTYTILGMMVIGLSLASLGRLKICYKFISVFLSSRCIASPLIALALIKLDQYALHIFAENGFVYKIMILLSIVPPAANTVVFATLNRCHPEQAAAAVLAGTVIAAIYIPIAVAWLI